MSELMRELEASAASADTLPHRRKYLLIVIGFLRRPLELHLDLVDDVERELAPSRSSRRRNNR